MVDKTEAVGDYMMTEMNIRAIIYVGLFPTRVKKSSILSKLHKWYSCINLSIFVSFFISMNIQLGLIFKDLFQLTYNLSISLLYTVNSAKISILIFRRKEVMSLLERTQKFQDQVMNGHHEENKKEFMKYVRHVRAFTLFIWCMVFTACNLFVLPGYLALFDINNRIDKDGTVTKQMAFSCYLYFDQQKHHTIAVFIQLLISVPGATYIGAWDTFIFALMTSGICQMKMLQNLLISLGQNKNKSIHESVVECVQLHQEIIQYITDLDELTSNVFFLDFLMYAALLCSIGYRAFFDPDVDMTLVITSSAYILAILVQLYMFYWNGHIIMEESEEIANAVWKSNWYHHDKSVLKSLLIIMIRAQKPLKLTVGLFNVLNVETSVIILRAWYSYMTILNTMEED